MQENKEIESPLRKSDKKKSSLTYSFGKGFSPKKPESKFNKFNVNQSKFNTN